VKRSLATTHFLLSVLGFVVKGTLLSVEGVAGGMVSDRLSKRELRKGVGYEAPPRPVQNQRLKPSKKKRWVSR
jgi:hypothetical protein